MFNKVLSIILIITMVFSSSILFTKNEVYAKDYGLENPRVSNKVSTWDCIYFGHYPQSLDENDGYKKEKIKWRVLSVDGDEAFILADKNLDVMEYNKTAKTVTWETSTIRSWLNGYGASDNADEIDYSSDNFIDRAFSSSEKNAIKVTDVDNGEYEKTSDRVYLLSHTEAENEAYGFSGFYGTESRIAKNTQYVVCGGSINVPQEIDNNDWWLRCTVKPYVLSILQTDYVDKKGLLYVATARTPTNTNTAVRPALHIDLSSDVWKNAGTVSSNGEETSLINNDFKSEDKVFRKDNGEGYYYTDDYFDKKATTYQHSLATMSLCMAFSSYGAGSDYNTYDANIKQIMTECGYADDERYEEYDFNKKPTNDSIGCAIGSKKIKDSTIIAVTVRSGGYEDEWASNVTLGLDGDHYGFSDAANKVYNNINDYINKKNITGKTKIWITGYSRGAAVATQTAAKLNNNMDIGKENIYAYGFATPAGAINESNPHSSKYNNIYNIIEFNDIVPLVAPGKWKFDRYGETKIFPFRESSNSNDYANYIKMLSARLADDYSLDDFIKLNKDTLGSYSRKLINAISEIIKSRDQYNYYYQDRLKFLLGDLPGGMGVSLVGCLFVMPDLIPELALQDSYLTSVLIANNTRIADVHQNQKYYVYWMQMMDDNYENSLPVKWGNKNYRVVRINCPVDVEVYDENNNKVASIKNDKPVNDGNSSIVSSVDENLQKIIYLPIEEKYDVEILAREKCEVSCGVEEYNSEFGDKSRIVNFKDVALDESHEVDASIDSFSDEEIENGASSGSDAEYSLTKPGSNVAIDSDIKGKEDIENHSYNVEVEYDGNQGTVYGGGVFTEGSYAKLDAECKEGYEFEGFYIDNKRIENSGSEYERNSVRFKVEDHTKVVAKFNKTKVDKETTNNTKPNGIKKTTARNTNVKLAKPSIKKIKARKKSLKVFWKKKKGISGYKLQYSLKKSFKKAKTIIIKKPLKRTKLIKKLKRHKKYFLRIRTFKIVGSKMYLSAWSKRKIKRTK